MSLRDETAANQIFLFCANPFSSSLSHPNRKLLLGEGPRDIERHFVAHDVVTGPGELVSHRFDRYHGVSLGFLSLIEPTNERFIANGKIGRPNSDTYCRSWYCPCLCVCRC
jgi:hypothetical protein